MTGDERQLGLQAVDALPLPFQSRSKFFLAGVRGGAVLLDRLGQFADALDELEARSVCIRFRKAASAVGALLLQGGGQLRDVSVGVGTLHIQRSGQLHDAPFGIDALQLQRSGQFPGTPVGVGALPLKRSVHLCQTLVGIGANLFLRGDELTDAAMDVGFFLLGHRP